MLIKKDYHAEQEVVRTFDSRRPEAKAKHTQFFKLVTTYKLFGIVPVYRTKETCYGTLPVNFPAGCDICVRIAGNPLITQLRKVTVRDNDICFMDIS